jgi:hypothetical protein
MVGSLASRVARVLRAVPLALLVLSTSSCVALHRAEVKRRSQYAQIELERVAKDWSQTIRASQVIPVYPLTEDLQPGDVFLVTRTVDEQHEEYTERGYLALSNHVARIDPLGYVPFYAHSFAAQDLPRAWLEPGQAKSFQLAPAAAFPTYSFSVKSGSAFSGALPIQGVPVGLSLLGASEATGSVTIADARTYGVDMLSLSEELRVWGRKHADFLAQYGTSDEEGEKERYLRVVTRVFLTGRLDVSLNAASSTSAGLSVGVPTPAEIPALSVGKKDDPSITATSYTAAITALNSSLATDGAPGAKLEITAASANSVSLSEKFPRPIVIGYLGFDVRIGPGGMLGSPMPTYAVLSSREHPAGSVAAPGAETSQVVNTYRILRLHAAQESDAAGPYHVMIGELDGVGDELLPAKRPVPIRDSRLAVVIEEGSPIDRTGGAYRALLSYLDALRGSSSHLSAKLDADPTLADERRTELTRVEVEIARIEIGLYVTNDALLKRAEQLASRE